MKVIIATNNQDKAVEIKRALDLDGWEFFTLADLGLDSDPDETADTFAGNAQIKVDAARAAADAAGLCDFAIMADDSGLCVDALDGAPGVFSARYADIDGQHATYADNNEKLLAALKDVPDHLRTAHFETVSVFEFPDGRALTAVGTCEGVIGHKCLGEHGFGYDPIFLPDAFKRKISLAQVSREDKLKISHRGKSLELLAAKLR